MGAYINHDNVKIVTNNGEVTINLKLDLNINLSGELQQALANNIYAKKANEETILNSKEEKTMWEVPDFSPSKTRVNFGKQE